MAAVAVAPASFQEIENLYCGSVYPGPQHFKGCKTALCLFSAMWHGQQDVYWPGKLAEMQAVYPAGWEFVNADVFDYVDGQSRRWDVVTLDPWTGQFERCASMLPVWTTLARKVVVLGHGNYRLREPEAPDGWHLADRFKRSDFKGGVWWLVFAHD
jgi:hypothetical protein